MSSQREPVAFTYDPFDANVMANPLPYYGILRDHHPVYYMPQWDTFALSRFDDIWQVLQVNEGTFVASEGTLPAAAVLAKHNTGPVDDPPLHPLPFHAVFDTDLYAEIRRAHSTPLRHREVAGLEDRIRELERLYVPWSERTGKRWLGSFTTTFRYNEVIHYWALDGGWECFANHYPSWKESPPAEIVTWMSVAPALRDGWEDSILQALPPSPLQ